MAYGVFSLSEQTLMVMFFVMSIMLGGACYPYATNHRKLGLLLQLLTFIPLTILIVTWMTADTWSGPVFVPPLVGLAAGVATLFGPPLMGQLMSIPEPQ